MKHIFMGGKISSAFLMCYCETRLGYQNEELNKRCSDSFEELCW